MCLCSVPTPKKIISAMYALLKPGGTVLVLEHVRSNHPVMYVIQSAYTIFGWRYFLDGCELNRPTGQYLVESGNTHGRNGWKKVELQNLPGEGWWSIFPHVFGRLVKA
jgi:ubiquinone/menaquinone biosynthesis C-methylase UbiE